MTDEEKIREIVAELNRTKSEVVTAAKDFVTHGKHIVNHTSKEQDKSGNIITIVKKAVELTTANIPDIKIAGGAVPKPATIKILYPSNGMKFEEGKDIKLEFETTNILTPFMYHILGQEKASAKAFQIKAFRSHNPKVLINSIKENDKIPLKVGTYRIAVRVLHPSKRTDVAPPAMVMIQVVPAVGPVPGPNTIEIISPVGAKSPYTTMPIPIQFRVNGPHHDAGKDYVYIIIVTDASGKKVFNERGMTKNKDITHAKSLNLPDGKYTIFITTADPATKKILAQSKKEVFVVKIGGGPVPPVPRPKSRGYAIFSVVVGGKDILSGNTYTTEIETGKKTIIKVKNSGKGGNLVWRSKCDPWMKLSPSGSSRSLKADESEEVIIEFDMTKLAALRTKGINYGRLLIEGAKGTRINPADWKTIAGNCLINFKLK